MVASSGYTSNAPSLLAGGNFVSYTASSALPLWLLDKVVECMLMLSSSMLMGIVLRHQVLATKDTEPTKFKGYHIYIVPSRNVWSTACCVHAPPLQVAELTG